MSRITSAALGLLLAVIAASPSSAGFVLQFGQAGAVGDNAFAGSAGDTIVAEVYLTQTNGEARLSVSDTALAIADFHVTINGTSVTPVATTFGPGFVDDGSGNTHFTLSEARIAEFEAGGSGHVGVTTGDDGVVDDSVLLGTVSFLVLPGASGIYDLSIVPDPSLGAFSLASPADLPESISVTAGAGTLAISAVPEPSSLALAAIGASAVICRARLRRRKRSDER